jgi:hypothetical protein
MLKEPDWVFFSGEKLVKRFQALEERGMFVDRSLSCGGITTLPSKQYRNATCWNDSYVARIAAA